MDKLIGIKIVQYESFAELIKILRKYNKGSISEIKSQIQNDDLNNQLAAMMIMMGNEVFSDIKELGWS